MKNTCHLVPAVSMLIGGAVTTAIAELGLAMGSIGSSAWYLGLLLFLLGGIFAIIEYIVAVRDRRRVSREMRCRRCGHVLRSLTEPKCPECGEAI